ncbi:hypothetical protein GCM10010174_11380 [Kutzneria viridogrisea]|uniref:Biotin carboxylation domain-containing protein n=2 Tax=Kutzneria TaxID=43356 RepID=W5WJ80_9PSEU|nr:biotin carboxylase N-terminal domain-containing protein [Kutzneria albida]AHI01259.1 hypothetical protein KALB_7901 [Kutzneria albida DSM 43870]MBA8926512.1 acetyl-CoA carboxylase biotin carboxylase subunit [Kutzneria viridogrisea]
MLESVLAANRGEIARRVLRTARESGLRTVAVHSDVDAELPFVLEAYEAVLLGGAAPAESYRDAERVLDAARKTGVRAVHPGYGFLSENAEFAQAVLDAGLVWVGPPPAAIPAMGDKVEARGVLAAAGVPVAPGSADAVSDVDGVVAEDPRRFLPGPGAITEWVEPAGAGVRVDSGYTNGNEETPA